MYKDMQDLRDNYTKISEKDPDAKNYSWVECHAEYKFAPGSHVRSVGTVVYVDEVHKVYRNRTEYEYYTGKQQF